MFVNFKRLLLALYRIEETQQEILTRLDRLEKRLAEPTPPAGDKWLEDGIENILGYQAGKKRGEGE